MDAMPLDLNVALLGDCESCKGCAIPVAEKTAAAVPLPGSRRSGRLRSE